MAGAAKGPSLEEVVEKLSLVWQRKLQCYAMRVFSDLEEAMEWVANQETLVSEADINKRTMSRRTGSGWGSGVFCSRQALAGSGGVCDFCLMMSERAEEA